VTLHPHQPPSLFAADAKAQAAIERLKTPRDIKRYLRARQGYEAALEACEQIWPAWSANGCRKLDLRVSRWITTKIKDEFQLSKCAPVECVFPAFAGRQNPRMRIVF